MNLTNNQFLDNPIKANADGRNVLILYKLDSPIYLLGKRKTYQLEYRWLSVDPTEQGDEVCCLKGNEFNYYTEKELKELNVFDDNVSLFDCFCLY